ncbi:16S rRNA (uracil(1498)-N(3))-methyltransferase [Candidatus Uhrbacteria bacterium]|nr:MAG: 16S rRNA (uracil(1498)-N(3))-methyltransferase [Candidatus Uhrbacteria bacterium]
MKLHRFIGPYDLRATEIVLEDDAARQMTAVLKLRTGERVLLCDGQGREAEYELLNIAKGEVGLARMGEARRVVAEPSRFVTLYAAILKRESFEWAVQKATECGASEIVPLVTDRTIKKDVRLERLYEIAREAAEQSGRGVVPAIMEPMKFEEAMQSAKGEQVFFDAEGSELDSRLRGNDKRASLFVGPEGGWTPEESEIAKRAGATIASLGPRVLRGETACAVAVYLMTT